jgi:hypothetical protein
MEFICEIPNALPKKICQDIIDKFLKDDNKKPSSTFSGVDSSIRKSTNLWISDSHKWKDTINVILKTFLEGMGKYKNYLLDSKYMTERTIDNLFQTLRFESLFVNQSEEGEYYSWHVDDTNKRQSNAPRTFTCLLYLNTLEEDQGGCTEFMCGKKVRPEQGKLLIFPSCWTYEHRGAEVKNSGIKYTCGSWVG